MLGPDSQQGNLDSHATWGKWQIPNAAATPRAFQRPQLPSNAGSDTEEAP